MFFIGKGWRELLLLLLTDESVISTAENSLYVLGTGVEKISCCFKMLRHLGIDKRHFNSLKTAVNTKPWMFLGSLSDNGTVELSHLANPFYTTHCCSQNCHAFFHNLDGSQGDLAATIRKDTMWNHRLFYCIIKITMWKMLRQILAIAWSPLNSYKGAFNHCKSKGQGFSCKVQIFAWHSRLCSLLVLHHVSQRDCCMPGTGCAHHTKLGL